MDSASCRAGPDEVTAAGKRLSDSERPPACMRARRSVEALGDGIGPIEGARLRRHARRCPECGSYFRRMNAVLDALAAIPVVRAPEGFRESVVELAAWVPRRVEVDEGWPAGGRWKIFVLAGAAGAGVVAAVALAVLRRLMGRDRDGDLSVAEAA